MKGVYGKRLENVDSDVMDVEIEHWKQDRRERDMYSVKDTVVSLSDPGQCCSAYDGERNYRGKA